MLSEGIVKALAIHVGEAIQHAKQDQERDYQGNQQKYEKYANAKHQPRSPSRPLYIHTTNVTLQHFHNPSKDNTNTSNSLRTRRGTGRRAPSVTEQDTSASCFWSTTENWKWYARGHYILHLFCFFFVIFIFIFVIIFALFLYSFFHYSYFHISFIPFHINLIIFQLIYIIVCNHLYNYLQFVFILTPFHMSHQSDTYISPSVRN